MMSDATLQSWFDSIWTQREEEIYQRFFGQIHKGMFPLTGLLFSRYGKKDPDPRFLTHGVLVSPPGASRATWLYVTSGMSNPWGATPETTDPNEYSGLGFELVMETPVRAPWAISVLQWLMVVQLMVATGDAEGELIAYGDRIPIGAPIDGGQSELNTLLICEPVSPCAYPGRFALLSGKVDLMLCVGITQREREFAAAQGSEGVLDLLRHHDVFASSDPARASCV